MMDEKEHRPPSDSAPVLEISGIRPGTSKELVEMFIENKSQDFGLQMIQYDPTTGVAVFAFTTAEGAEQLMGTEDLMLEGWQLVCAQRNIKANRETDRPRAIEVQGIHRNTPKIFLELFFESQRKCSGGDIEELDYDAEEGTAIIIFKEADTANRVAQHGSLVVNGSHVKVKLTTPSTSQPVPQGRFEDNLVVVSEISPRCTGDDLKTFFSRENTNNKVPDVIVEGVRSKTAEGAGKRTPVGHPTCLIQTTQSIQALAVELEAKLQFRQPASCMHVTPSDGSTSIGSVTWKGSTADVAQGGLTTFPADVIVTADNEQLEDGEGFATAFVDAEQEEVVSRLDDTQDWNRRTVEVVGVVASTPGDVIVKCFQRKLPGIESTSMSVHRHPSKNLIYVTFESVKAAQKIQETSLHHIDGATCTVGPATGVNLQSLVPVNEVPGSRNHVHGTVMVGSTHEAMFQASGTSLMDPLRAFAHSDSSSSLPASTRVGPLTIEILHGDLTMQDTQVIVNSSNGKLSLKGSTAQAIVAAGGEDVVKECEKCKYIPSNGIVVTGSGRLPCSKIIHINALMKLTEVIENALAETEGRLFKSIAFPALGTGNLKQNPIKAANTMLKGFRCFIAKHPSPKYLQLVRIVIYQEEMMKCFKQCFRCGTGTTASQMLESGQQTGIGEVWKWPDSDRADMNSDMTTGRQLDMQVQWMYADGKTFVAYPVDMNCMLEAVYHRQPMAYEWTDNVGNKQHLSLEQLTSHMKKDEMKRVVAFGGVQLPAIWYKIGMTRHEDVVKLKQGSNEYKNVLQNFTRSSGISAKGSIEITRIQNQVLYRQHMLYREKLTRLTGQNNNTEQLWYNASQDDVAIINNDGFSAVSVMFTKRPSRDNHSAQRTSGEKYVYQVQVVIGKCRKRDTTTVDTHFDLGYDTMFDTSQHAYVVSSGDQAYPEYLIKY